MCVIVGVAVLGVSLSFGDCSRLYQQVFAKPLPPITLLHPANSEESPSLSAPKSSADRFRMPPSRRSSASLRPRATASRHVMHEKFGNRAVADSKPGAASGKSIGDGYASMESANKALEGFKVQCKDIAEGTPATIDTVGRIASALTLGKTDQAVCAAKAYIDTLKVNVARYYWDLATNRSPTEQFEETVNLVPGTSLFERPEQGINNLKALRQRTERELEIDKTDAKFAEARRNTNERILNARRIIGSIGTNEDLDHALMYLNTLLTEPQWPDFVKMVTAAIEEDAAVKYATAEAKAKKLGGVQKLTREDIGGLSYQQIKQLRGY